MDTVEKYHAILHFRWKIPKKSEKFICLLSTRRKCRSQGAVEDFFGKPLGPLPTGLLKPSKVLVTNSGDRASEVKKDSTFSNVESFDTRRTIFA